MSLTILRPGVMSSIQDLGRPGFRASGVTAGGALDQHALRVANLLVGNAENAAGVELTLGGFHCRFEELRVVAWCGGGYVLRIGESEVPPGRPFLIGTGEELRVERPTAGCRGWISISDGIDVPVVLGSRSTDLRGKFGGVDGRPLREGDRLALGRQTSFAIRLIERLRHGSADWSAPNEWTSTARSEPVLRFVSGPAFPHREDATGEWLAHNVFTVSPDSDRMGVRLAARDPRPGISGSERLSEPVAPGALQLPPGGNPILLLGDCQTIGGYPNIAHVITVDLPIAAQLRAGDSVRFQRVSLAHAQQVLLEREDDLDRFRIGLALRLER